MDLKKFRYDYRLGQSELAELFGCKQANISLIENGTRKLTSIQIRLMIDKFGRETIEKYAEPGELPAENPSITVNMPNMRENKGQMNSGGNNTMQTNDANLIAVMKQQSDQISTLLQQQERLIALLEKNNK